MNHLEKDSVTLAAPVDPKVLQNLELGTIVYLDGIIYTGREGAYKKIIDEGISPPIALNTVSNINFHCSPAATVNPDGSYSVGAVTATASFRFSKWMKRWFDLSDCQVIVGKGGMSEDDYQQLFVPKGAVYLTTVGYGTGALLGRGIRRVVDVLWLDELGIAQAIWILEVENFGPFLVESDRHGNSLFEKYKDEIDKNIASLYSGLKEPALRRYGETTDRTDEVI